MNAYGLRELFVLGALFFMSSALAAPQPPEGPKLPVVFVEKARKIELFDELTYPARLDPKINASLLSESDGVVTRIVAPLGRRVKRGQVVLRLRHTDPVYEYAPMAVRAPVGGVVSAVDVTVGSRVIKGQKLAAITDPGQVRIVVETAVTDLPAIQRGLRGELKLEGAEQNIPVRVIGVSPFVDPATGTATTELKVLEKPKVKGLLRPGRVGRVFFKVRPRKGFQVPLDAVVYRGKETFVRVVNEKKAKLVPVKLGASHREMVEIIEGLSEGNEFVVRASQYVADGEEVSVQKTASE